MRFSGIDLKTEKTESVGMPIPCMAFNPVVAPDGNIYGFRAKERIQNAQLFSGGR